MDTFSSLTSRQHNLKARGSSAPYEFRSVNSLVTYNVVQPAIHQSDRIHPSLRSKRARSRNGLHSEPRRRTLG